MSTTIDAAELSLAQFLPLVGQDFSLHLPEGGTLRLSLDEAEPVPGSGPPDLREPFLLLFRCPDLPPGRFLRQGSYRVEHAALGATMIFITPIQPDARGMRYQAVYS
jgi:hypothetical protein